MDLFLQKLTKPLILLAGVPSRSFERESCLARLRWLARITARQSSFLASLGTKTGGAEGIRTPDPHNAIVVLYQLSYDPSQSGPHNKLPRAKVKAFCWRPFARSRSVSKSLPISFACGAARDSDPERQLAGTMRFNLTQSSQRSGEGKVFSRKTARTIW